MLLHIVLYNTHRIFIRIDDGSDIKPNVHIFTNVFMRTNMHHLQELNTFSVAVFGVHCDRGNRLSMLHKNQFKMSQNHYSLSPLSLSTYCWIYSLHYTHNIRNTSKHIFSFAHTRQNK